MEWILILVLSSGYYQAVPTVATATFNNKDACTTAGNATRVALMKKDPYGVSTIDRIEACICVPKGNPIVRRD